MTKIKKLKTAVAYKSKYALGGKLEKPKMKKSKRKFVAGGSQYDQNTISAFQNPNYTGNIVAQGTQESADAASEHFDSEAEKLKTSSETMVNEMKNEDEQTKQRLIQEDAANKQKQNAVESTAQTAAQTITEGYKKFAPNSATAKETKGDGIGGLVGSIGQARNQWKAIGDAKKAAKFAKGFNETKTAFDVGQRLSMGEDAYKLSQSMKNVSNMKTTLDQTKVGMNMFDKGSKGLDMLNKGKDAGDVFKKGTELASTMDKTTGLLKLGEKTQKLSTMSKVGTAAKTVGAGVKSFATSASGLGLIANYAGKGISKLSDDGDPTKSNFGEYAGAALSTAGSWAGTGAMIGSVIPGIGNAVGGAVGAVAGALYGVGKTFFGTRKAKRAKAKADQQRAEKVGAYNEKLKGRFGHAAQSARAMEIKSKTTSGQDLGWDTTRSRYGGIRKEYGGQRQIPAYAA